MPGHANAIAADYEEERRHSPPPRTGRGPSLLPGIGIIALGCSFLAVDLV